MPIRLGAWAFILALLAGALAVAPAARAQAADEGLACGRQLSGPVLAKWTQMGGQAGSLGCPLAAETPASTSPGGSSSREADFSTGMILWHASGPRAGQTFAVTGCIWRLYFQFGGASGWLGLPTSDAINFPDGQRQDFEGGRITYLRAPDECTAERTAEIATAAPPSAAPAPAPAPAPTSPLDALLDSARGDHLSAASAGVVNRALGANYVRVGNQAQVFDSPGPGTAPLKLFWNEARGDHETVATAEGESDAFAQGYQFEASEGYVWTDPHPGAQPLQQFRDPASGHHWLAVSPEEAANAKAAGFVFVRIEGYAPTGG